MMMSHAGCKTHVLVALVAISVLGCAATPKKAEPLRSFLLVHDPGSKDSAVAIASHGLAQGSTIQLVPLADRLAHRRPTSQSQPASAPAALATLAQAKKAYRELRFADALAQLGQAQRALLSTTVAPRRPKLLAQLALHQGLCHHALKQRGRAAEAFAFAFRLDSGVMEPGAVPPEIARFVTTVQRDEQAATPGTLAIHGGSSLTIFVDGNPRGQAPRSLSLAPGLHHLRLSSAGHHDANAVVRIRSGQSERVHLSLRPYSGSERLQTLKDAMDKGQPFPQDRSLVDLVAKDDPLLTRGASNALLLWRPNERSPTRCVQQAQPQREGCILAALGFRPPPPSSTSKSQSRSVFKRWWFWTAVGVVVAGSATAIGIAATSGEEKTDLFIRIP